MKIAETIMFLIGNNMIRKNFHVIVGTLKLFKGRLINNDILEIIDID